MSTPAGVSIRGDKHTAWGAAGIFTWTKNNVIYTAQIVKSGSKSVDGEEATLPGSVGNTVNHVAFDDRKEATVDITWRDNEVYPDRRDEATVCGVSAMVLKVEQSWENKGFRGCKVTIKAYDAAEELEDASESSEETSSESGS
jgi:hypothetical protein